MTMHIGGWGNLPPWSNFAARYQQPGTQSSFMGAQPSQSFNLAPITAPDINYSTPAGPVAPVGNPVAAPAPAIGNPAMANPGNVSSVLTGAGIGGDKFKLDQANAANAPNAAWSNANTVINGVGMAGNLVLAGYGMHKANEAFDFQKGMAEQNLAASIASYNTNLKDKLTKRYSNQDPTVAQAKITEELEKGQLKDTRSTKPKK